MNRRAVAFARELAGGRANALVNGVIGPRGDARGHHAWQVGVLHPAGADRVTAVTMPQGGDRVVPATSRRSGERP